MGKLKSVFVSAACVGCAFLAGSGTAAGESLREAAFFTAGVSQGEPESSSTSVPRESMTEESEQASAESNAESYFASSSSETTPIENSKPEISEISEICESISAPIESELPVKRGRLIVKNRTEGTDDTDYSIFTEKSGEVLRYNFGYFDDPNIVTLDSGAQIRNLTEQPNADLLDAAGEPFYFDSFELGSDEPQVLIYHTHTTESFLPFSDVYDAAYPDRSEDENRNMTAVGDAICESLVKRGISVVHECRVHDSPMYTGSYYRSAETLLEDLKEFPSIKIAIDIHRDGIINADGSVTAPVAEINGKTAAQFMIITGCDGDDVEIPQYIENLKLACAVQNASEKAYPTLARPVLFDYRNYNQSIFTGCLLIEVGSQGNSLDEAVYTGELLGDILADTLVNNFKPLL